MCASQFLVCLCRTVEVVTQDVSEKASSSGGECLVAGRCVTVVSGVVANRGKVREIFCHKFVFLTGNGVK